MKNLITIIIFLIYGSAIAQYDVSGDYKISGKVGIGTTSLSKLLTVSEATNPTIRINSARNSSSWVLGDPFGTIEFYSNDGSGAGVGIRSAIRVITTYTTGAGSNMIFTTGSTTENDVERMRINHHGNVGIGTNSPSSKLHVRSGESNGSPHSYSKLTVEHSDNAMISILTPNDKISYFGFADSDDSFVGGIQYSHSSNTMQFRVNNESTGSLLIKSNGNIGIGNSNPGEKLVVDGKILAEEVKVQTVPASDYVFEPDYVLKPISEVERFVKENKHLPDIPSAEEFKENGVGLGEMDDMLLRKIEELTLYLINQNQKIDKQNTRIEELENIIQSKF